MSVHCSPPRRLRVESVLLLCGLARCLQHMVCFFFLASNLTFHWKNICRRIKSEAHCVNLIRTNDWTMTEKQLKKEKRNSLYGTITINNLLCWQTDKTYSTCSIKMYPLLTATYFLFMGLLVGQGNLLAHAPNDYLLYILQRFFGIILFYMKLWGQSHCIHCESVFKIPPVWYRPFLLQN